MIRGAVSSGIRCRSYAKINLYLDVLERRSDGFHDIETIFQTVSLADELDCRLAESELTLQIEGADGLGASDDNLVMKAAHALRNRYGVSEGAQMILRKRIPVAAGLAGGSGDAAAALLGLACLWNLDPPMDGLMGLAAELGSDVPFCLMGGTVAGTGRGERLKRLSAIEPSWFILAHPALSVSTPEMFNHPALKKSHARPMYGERSSGFHEAIVSCARGRIEEVFGNALESAAFVAYPEIEGIKKALQEAGCLGVLMSGSGPTVFGLCENESHARSIQAGFDTIATSIVHSVDDGVELERID